MDLIAGGAAKAVFQLALGSPGCRCFRRNTRSQWPYSSAFVDNVASAGTTGPAFVAEPRLYAIADCRRTAADNEWWRVAPVPAFWMWCPRLFVLRFDVVPFDDGRLT